MSSNAPPADRFRSTDVLIIGGGAAGMSLALRIADHAKVTILSKSSLKQGSTYYAQGGIAAVLDKTDSLDAHLQDTLVSGAGLCHPDIVEYTGSRGRESIEWLLDQGVAFTRDDNSIDSDGFHLSKEGGHSHRPPPFHLNIPPQHPAPESQSPRSAETCPRPHHRAPYSHCRRQPAGHRRSGGDGDGGVAVALLQGQPSATHG